jgi:hypothetical protein
MEMQRCSIRRHLTNQHQTFERPTRTSQRRISTQFTNPTITYAVSMPVNQTILTPCPVPECQGTYQSRQSMRTHFQHRHWNDVVVIEKEACYLSANDALCSPARLTPNDIKNRRLAQLASHFNNVAYNNSLTKKESQKQSRSTIHQSKM